MYNYTGFKHSKCFSPVTLIAVRLSTPLARFEWNTLSLFPAGFSEYAVLKYMQKEYHICRIYDVQASACMNVKYNFNMQLSAHACHIHIPVCTWCLVVSKFTAFSIKLWPCERSIILLTSHVFHFCKLRQILAILFIRCYVIVFLPCIFLSGMNP